MRDCRRADRRRNLRFAVCVEGMMMMMMIFKFAFNLLIAACTVYLAGALDDVMWRYILVACGVFSLLMSPYA